MWNIEKVRSGKPNKWNYIDGCMITACLSLYKTTGDEKYLSFSKDFIDFFVQEDGSIKTYDPKEYNLDNVNQGKNLFTLYDLTGEQRQKMREFMQAERGKREQNQCERNEKKRISAVCHGRAPFVAAGAAARLSIHRRSGGCFSITAVREKLGTQALG